MDTYIGEWLYDSSVLEDLTEELAVRDLAAINQNPEIVDVTLRDAAKIAGRWLNREPDQLIMKAVFLCL